MIQSGRTRRGLVLLLVAVVLTVVGTASVAAWDGSRAPSARAEGPQVAGELAGQPGPFGTVPSGTVGVASALGYFSEAPCPCFAWVVGEVINLMSTRRVGVSVTVTFYDGNDVVQGTAEVPVYLERLAPGSVSPFLVEVQGTPDDTWTYLLTVDPGTAATQVGGGLRVTQGATTSGSGLVQYHGTVTNPNPFPVEFVDANVTLYDSAGDVIDVWWAYTEPDVIPAFGSGDYTVEFFIPAGGLGAIARVGVTSQGWREATETYVTSWDNYFDDTGTSIYRKDIIWLAENGITSGCAAGKYCPTNNVRRDEMASFLSRALGLTGTPPDAFVDDNGTTHELNINRIRAAGITTGCNIPQQLYCPANNVRRDEMASFLSRSLELTGTQPNAFVDDNGNTHEININRIAAAGITNGCNVPAQLYCPTDFVTRGQMAAFLRRAFED